MKKPVVKALSITLCAVLALGGLGGAAYAMNTSGEAAHAPAEPQVKTASAPGGRNLKDETVYVLASADGSVDKIIVSDWVQNVRGDALIDDVTRLTGIENL
ncbi:MAG: hypothetical protein K2P08_01765 [Oscillospiraceae bacterium]|nr:hypothetical protein [Oscillospiraceae bacterium]